MKSKSVWLAFAAKLLIFALVCLGTVMMVSGFGEGASLTAKGLKALRYFTVQSNLFAGLVALLYALALARILRGRAAGVPGWLQTLMLVATAAVMLTFLVVSCFFVPLFGPLDLFKGANFWFHLVVPLLAIVSFLFFDRFAPIKKSAVLLAAIPMLLYGVFYAGNCLINGVGDYANDPNDWYYFLYWGLPVGVAIFAVLCGVTVGFSALLRLGNQARYKKAAAKAARS